jgi:N-acetylmuramoyl-L-alanine amidase CwlA
MDTDWYISEATINNAIELTKYLMDKYKIPADNVIMHHQVTGKLCPQPWCLNESRLNGWYDFKKKLTNSSDVVDKIIKISINAKIDEYKAKNVKGNNYVEARKFLEALGYQVGFNNEKKRVMVDNTLTIDVPTIIENGFSYIHLRDTIDFLNKYDTFRYTQDKTVTYDSKRDVIIIS